MAESRKLQQTGGSTLIVSLPKKWINKNKLEAGSEVRLRKQPDGTINIDPGKSDTNKKTSIVHCNDEESQHLFRDLIGVYLAGGTEIKVLGTPRLTVKERKTIRKFSASVIGFEIIEEEATQVIISKQKYLPQSLCSFAPFLVKTAPQNNAKVKIAVLI